MPFELARTLLCLGRVERRRKLRKCARAALGQALDIFERVGTPLWATMARTELERTHLREAPCDLSPTELRVAEMAGSGLTNRQIATRLFVSPKTVEGNLARAYAKLGIRSRPNWEPACRGASRTNPSLDPEWQMNCRETAREASNADRTVRLHHTVREDQLWIFGQFAELGRRLWATPRNRRSDPTTGGELQFAGVNWRNVSFFSTSLRGWAWFWFA